MNTTKSATNWYDKTWLVILLCVLFFPVGLYALWKNQSIAKGLKIAITAIIGLFVIAQFGKGEVSDAATSKNGSTSTNNNNEIKTEEAKSVRVGEVLHTDYFDITVNKVSLENRVSTGNQFADLKPEAGHKYLIINASFKNVDTESRMLLEGSVWINYNGKNYEFDKSETIMLEGWGLMLEQINPLTSKTTNLVYKIPDEVKGDAYWQPGRADSDERILLGNIE